MSVTQEEVLSALKQCYDPEIPVNIVDLGLIYEVRFELAPEGGEEIPDRFDVEVHGRVPTTKAV